MRRIWRPCQDSQEQKEEEMNRLEALVALNMVAEIGSIRLKKLLDYFEKPENIVRATADKLTVVSGIGEKTAAGITALKKEDIDKELSLANKLGLDIFTLDDSGYPDNLKNIPDPPIVLYVKGQLKEEDRLSIAIVGSRRASFYGLSSAGKFAADLAGQGFSVVSGMARGIAFQLVESLGVLERQKQLTQDLHQAPPNRRLQATRMKPRAPEPGRSADMMEWSA